MTVLGLILARGGSKRVPGKNVRLLGGKPLVAWTIEAARRAERLNKIVVSADNGEILDACDQYDGGVHLHERAPWMAADHMDPYPSILDALDEFPLDYVCLLQPTSPFRTAEDIDACIDLASNLHAPAAVSAQFGGIEPNGAVYVGRSGWLLKGGNFDHPRIPFYYMPAERSLDIDTEEDWAEAEAMVARLAA